MIRIPIGLKGLYKIESFRVDDMGYEITGSRKIKADWFENLIVDQGLEFIGTESNLDVAYRGCQVGSGNTPPQVSDTTLQNLIATSGSTIFNLITGVDTSGDPYVWGRKQYRFDQGAAEGNLAEIAVGYDVGGFTMFSRALIQDSGGNPTTIQVLSDEILDVFYEFRMYPPISDAVGTVDIGVTTYDYIARASDAATYRNSIGGWSVTAGYNLNPIPGNGNRAYSGSIGSTTGSPTGSAEQPSTRSRWAYTPGSHSRRYFLVWELDDANFGGIRSVKLTAGPVCYQFEFSAQGTGGPIPKDNTNELRLDFVTNYARASI